MTPPAVEFHRPLAVVRVPEGGSAERVEADAQECRALAARLGLPAIHGLSADVRVEPWRAGGLKVEGVLTADIDQVCVVTLDAFRSTVAKPVKRFFLPAARMPPGEDADRSDADPIATGSIDLGELVAETLALELDPYPRKPGAVFDAQKAGLDTEPPSPFAGLASLKRPKA